MTKRSAGLTLDHVWIFAAVAFIALRALLTPIPPNDFWWHMATGRLIIESGQIPTVDSFSYTRAGEPFYNQSWLGQLLMYGLFTLGGAPLLILAQAALLAGTYGLLLRLCLRRTGLLRLSVAFLLVATMPASFDNWIVRPQTYALPLFVAYLYVLDGWRSGGWGLGAGSEGAAVVDQSRGSKHGAWATAAPLLLLPVLGIIWVNLHGSFVLGGALIGLTFVGEGLRRLVTDWREARAWARRPVGRAEDVLDRPPPPSRPPLRQLFLAGALTGAAWLINPGGLQVIGYVRDLLGSSAVTQLVTEWAPQTVRGAGGVVFFIFVMVGVVLLAYAPRRPDMVDMLLAGAFFWLALGAVRNNIWFIAVATPLLVGQLASWAPRDERPAFQGSSAINAALAGVIGLMLLLALPWVKPSLGLPPDVGDLLAPETPVAAVAFLEGERPPPERLFHEMSYGSYLIWADPGQKVWADPRIELYPLGQWLDYQRLSGGLEVDDLLAKYRIDGLLLSNETQESLVEYAKARPQAWEQRYADEETTYFVRR
ncbi:hypothetical protein K2Z83_21860 [Oscillochloris sp. ZM17-4]|uniref:hypothetical protein n=1 Tax=Oscillochloris sp. ZM17-4 TaxID=2866714 RepID=UPI001C73D61E|nr:hypothetical protein [Oscillochloris sp. ZM17-4]MBX0330314.1 hypothetical protein [Oscillochloris sp. ZM17-4]